MASSKPALLVAKPVRDKGIDAIMALFYGSNIVNKNGALERLKKEKIEKIASYDTNSNPILQEYSRLQREAGIPNPMPPAQHLIELVKANLLHDDDYVRHNPEKLGKTIIRLLVI